MRVTIVDRLAETVPPRPLRLPKQVMGEYRDRNGTDQHDQPAHRREQKERCVRDARADRLVREHLPGRFEVAGRKCLPRQLGLVGMEFIVAHAGCFSSAVHAGLC